jgi:diacylglycerol kinase family enzyme
LRVIVLTNPNAGARAGGANQLREALQSAGLEPEIREVPGEQLAAAATRALREPNVDAVVAAGGDGTVSAVAAALADTKTPLGVIPAGTLNHFARDLGLPLAVSPAARVISARHAKTIDLAEVNGRPFINNCSIGLYPHIIGQREDLRQRLGHNKWIAMMMAFLSVFRRYPTLRVRIGVGDRTVLRTTPFVFVGNNRYEMNLTKLGRRPRLDAGELCVYFANRTGRFGLFRLALRGLFGRLEQAKDFDALCVPELWIETPRKHLRVALDGEVIRLSPPLHYRIRPGALTVFVEPPAPPPAPSPVPAPTPPVETEKPQ